MMRSDEHVSDEQVLDVNGIDVDVLVEDFNYKRR